jgi:hypothetical protein
MTLWSVGPDATGDGKPRRGYIKADATGDIVARVVMF